MKSFGKISFFSIIKGIVLLFVFYITAYPFLFMLSVSLSDKAYVIRNAVSLLPKGLTLITYKYVLTDSRIYTAYLNTIILVVLGTLISLTITSTGAYAVSQKKMLFRKLFIGMLLIPMFFEGGIIPTFLTVKSYGLYNTIWAVILPYAVNMWDFFVMRSFFWGVPEELQEAGRMDGLKDIGIFIRIVLPLSKPVLAAIGLFYSVAYWNTYFAPLIYIMDPEKYPIQLVLRQLLLGETNDSAISAAYSPIAEQSLKYATIIIATLPIAMIYPFIQKYFTKGIMLGSIKG